MQYLSVLLTAGITTSGREGADSEISFPAAAFSSTADLLFSNSAEARGLREVASTFDLKIFVLKGTATITASSGMITAALQSIFPIEERFEGSLSICLVTLCLTS